MLMDFGSTTHSVIEIKSHKEALKYEDYFEENSSLAYRAPEMFNLTEGSVITEAADMWVSSGKMLTL